MALLLNRVNFSFHASVSDHAVVDGHAAVVSRCFYTLAVIVCDVMLRSLSLVTSRVTLSKGFKLNLFPFVIPRVSSIDINGGLPSGLIHSAGP